jgi:Flp pilus assembly protein TadD
MISRRSVRAAVAIAALLCATAALAVATPTVHDATPAALPEAYVGSRACAPCHAKEYEAWQGSNHDRAMQVADAQTVLGRFEGDTFTLFGVPSRFFKRAGKFFVRTEGPDGKPADFEIKYTFGVEPLQQYLIELPGGRLQAFTLAWDSRAKQNGGQRWFALYPNERIAPGDPLHWTGADQNWNVGCASCHSTNLRKHYDAETKRYATTWSEIDVACEACHGPGARHVEWAAKQGGTPAGTAAYDNGLTVHLGAPGDVQWSIDPQTGNARPSAPTRGALVVDTCAPCHARRGVIADDDQPGRPLLDAYLPSLLSEGLYHADGQIEGEVYEYGSFLQSKMYRQGVSCANCHAPHALQLRAPGNAVCAQCHLASKYDSATHHFHPVGSAGAQCVSCHMPTKTYMVIDPRHDHSLRVPRPDLSVEIGTPNACSQCHAERGAAWARDRVREWYGHDPAGYQTYTRALHAGRTGSADAAALLSQLAGDTAQPDIARATAFTLLPRAPNPPARGALEAGLRDGDPLVRRAALEALAMLPPAQRVAPAAPLLDDPVRAVRIEAAGQLAAVPLDALSPEVRQRFDRALGEYVEAQRVEADRPESHVNLGTLYAERGQLREAEVEMQAALALRADFTPAYVNLADLYRSQQRDAEGERVLRAGLAVAPKDAALHHALGLLLVRQKRLPEAIGALRQAAELQPDEPRFAYVFGVAEHAAGQTDQALETLRAAHMRHPADRDLLVALATISRDAGRADAAREWARQLVALAPDDPTARQLSQELSGSPPPTR